MHGAHQREGEVDTQRGGERQQARCGAKRCNAQCSASAIPSIYNAMEGGWSDQQADTAQHKQQSNGVDHLGLRSQCIEPLLEGAVELKAQQYLGAEHQCARFVKGSLHFAAERHGQWFSA